MPAVTPTNSTSTAHKDKPELQYWHLWTDEHGTSRQTRCVLTAFKRQSMGGAAPQWNDRPDATSGKVLFSVLPAGWTGDWHENPKPQWIVPLSGRWFVESMDGTRVELGVGEISFGGDQGCTADAQGRKGHRSGTLGDQPAVLMTVQLETAPERCTPCCFK
ncbi:MAG: cupin domain-containing protein [Gammaproteobacteria bacterium]